MKVLKALKTIVLGVLKKKKNYFTYV